MKELVRKEKADVMIYGEVRKEQRYKQFFSRDGHGYTYSGKYNESTGWPDVLEELSRIAQEHIGCEQEFDSALVNYYPDGDHVIGKHSDKDAMNGYIASFSFGASRRFHIREASTDKIVSTIDLHDGSILVMKPGMQQRYKHELPRMAKVKEGRINVTLRQQQHLSQLHKRKLDQA
jgi:alkylated DNA repair dioxygenase AlkB